MCGECRATRSAERADSVESPLRSQPQNDLRHASAHHLDCSTPISGFDELLDVYARCRRNLLARDVGLREWISKDSDVDEHDVHVAHQNAIANERVLTALGVERPDKDDGCPRIGAVARHCLPA